MIVLATIGWVLALIGFIGWGVSLMQQRVDERDKRRAREVWDEVFAKLDL